MTEDTTWSGLIHVYDTVTVPKNVTLKILPGTWVEFKHYRGYTEDTSVSLFIAGGTVIAIGTPSQQIWFTSDAEVPINGDWGGISCAGTNATVFKYVIVEFSTIGIEQWNSRVNISHSIVRWVNTEGIAVFSSSPLIEYNLLYGNAYHELILELQNPNVTVRYNIFKGGHNGIHVETSNVTIEGNYFVNYSGRAISGVEFSNMSIIGNKFENISDAPVWLGPTTSNTTFDNDFGSGTVSIPNLDFPDSKRIELGYIPGDSKDQYLYIYPEVDETRRVIKRLKNESTIGAALTYMNGSLWRFNLASYSKGPYQDFVKIDPNTGKNTFYGNDFVFNPRGLATDGHNFWVNDLTLRKIFKFTINSSGYLELLYSFNVSYVGGYASLACDGTFLYTLTGSTVHKIDMTGNLVSEITFQGAPLWGSIVWADNFFWGDSGIHLTKWYSNWTLAGKIYPVAWGTDALAWDGTYLWALQRTCELWTDGKIFQIEIINDQIII
ncbi:MAG: right-handed parallel beta-helix repeat-containing protein [Candidatus Heimdallarchaeota archaeon]|nr:MAG: right-handed parallel beta-helix repeat-containing protein [Candidatus Heimdallarchaeota archaeon]